MGKKHADDDFSVWLERVEKVYRRQSGHALPPVTPSLFRGAFDRGEPPVRLVARLLAA